MSVRQHIVSQFKRPHGPLGHLAGLIMAKRPSNRQRNLWTVEQLDCDPDDQILEIGCGPGLALAACLDAVPGGTVTGVDHSTAMIAQAGRRLAAPLRDGRLNLYEGGLDLLPRLGKHYDRIFSVNTAQFFPDLDMAFETLFAVTRPGGRVATTYMPRHRNPSRADALAFAGRVTVAMVKAGFAGTRTAELPLEPVPAICVLGERPAD